MGITIAYRGRLADLTRIEDFEDRLIDLALEVGGLAQIWRSYTDRDSQRVVRGVILNLAPGLESTSMLVSPEGWLIGLTDIEDAESGELKEPAWCFTKTQFGPLEGHVAVVETLAALKREFLPDLEVSDEGGYWETRNVAELARRHSFLKKAIEGMAEGLRRHGLSPEAAEDPDILVKRIERIAAQVQRVLQRPAEHPPVTFPDDEFPGAKPDPDAEEALWDEMFKHNRRQQERMQRSIEEHRSRGEDDEQAFEKALDDLALEVPGEDDSEESWSEDEPESFAEPFEAETESEDSIAEAETENDDPFNAAEERHPLLQHAMDLLHSLRTVFKDTDPQFATALQTLFQGAGDAMGGLAQAVGDYDDDFDGYGLRVTQLKRALRGLAFAQGALFLLREATSADKWEERYQSVKQLKEDVFAELARLRAEYRPQAD
jgi:hypothetical protein